ncbi:MAG: NIPSNAP family protein [Planctomycetota bacterium]|jgi:hypothetical protein
MKRREFLAAGVAGAAGIEAAAASIGKSEKSKRQYFELRQYHVLNRGKVGEVGNFLREVGIPAMNRIGINPVGVFTPMYGASSSTMYVLLVHRFLDSVEQASERLLADEKFRKSDFVNATLSEPGYVRIESSLMVAFKDMPKLEVPEKKSRIFELRIYESHGIKAAKKKIEMFNEGGEIAIFKKTGLGAVFFGETLIGPKMPNLTYMLSFDDMEMRDKRWRIFGSSPEWKKLRANPAYKDTVSNITDIILRPTRYSQI